MNLADLPPNAETTPYAAWKAAVLNRIFLIYGKTGKPGQISAETVRKAEARDNQECYDLSVYYEKRKAIGLNA